MIKWLRSNSKHENSILLALILTWIIGIIMNLVSRDVAIYFSPLVVISASYAIWYGYKRGYKK